MPISAKDIIVKPISVQDARKIIRSLHYSGKVDPRSKLNFGVFVGEKCGGAIQIGDPMDKGKVLKDVDGTGWSEMLDIHRIAFADWLPKNSESRAISIVLRMIKKQYPFMKWIQSYADACQCGDGTIYRASGFRLVAIKKNNSMWKMPDGEVVCKIVFEPSFGVRKGVDGGIKSKYGKNGGETSTSFLKSINATPLVGFQMRYIYFWDDNEKRCNLKFLPFSAIAEMGASMYKGKRRVGSSDSAALDNQSREDGASPISTLQPSPENTSL